MRLSISQVPPGLPEKKYVKLAKSDQSKIEKWIDNKLGPAAMKGQKDNTTTNRSECSHLTVLRGCPKCRAHSQTFSGRAMSAVHSMSIGVIDSVLVANARLGARNISDCPANSTRGTLRQREQYHKDRRKSKSYKISKYASEARTRRMRYNKPIKTRSKTFIGYGEGVQNPVVRHDHVYGK